MDLNIELRTNPRFRFIEYCQSHCVNRKITFNNVLFIKFGLGFNSMISLRFILLSKLDIFHLVVLSRI